MDDIDRNLLSIIQEGLDIDSRPFLILAHKLGISENDVIIRIKKLKELGYIRRIGGIFDSKKLGYSSTLCAASVPQSKIELVSSVINSYDEVTHNYIRNDDYNMWFTIIAHSSERMREIISNIKNKTGVYNIVSLPAIKLFKLKATFNISEGGKTDV
ncbi:Lrp/AsnC family transcriptional regulator [Clostridium chromiireducens]|uniref:siroheme decarboxylase n=1 Tax=Clostridium chromiireducens TaxID=225345 RepID=A0A399IK65_9CLOT|nr:AsnC family transcriptional regulator [Clostridium chromiireducens]RII31832.1 Lrp/AsnC family transcriptional regulator [Clostridium chromiireducens]